MNKRNKQNGITLIALILTIILLLILAGVVIGMLTGENGILKNAEKAADNFKREKGMEQIQLVLGDEVVDRKITKAELTAKRLKDIFETKDWVKYVGEIEGKDGITIINDEGYLYEVIINEDGKIETECLGKNSDPRISEIEVISKDTISISIKVKTANAEGAKYTYWYKKEGEENYVAQATQIEEDTFIYTGLEGNVIYTIKVEVQTNTGRAEEEINVLTGELLEGVVTFSTPEWNNGEASVTVSTDSGNQILYQKNGKNGTWIEIENEGVISNLTHGDIIYVVLYDGTKYGNYSSADIKDEDNPNEAQISVVENNLGNLKINVTQSDNQTGVNIEKCKWVLSTKNSEIGTDEKDYTGGGFTSLTEELTFSLDVGDNYYLHVLTVDNAGNKNESISELILIDAVAKIGNTSYITLQTAINKVPTNNTNTTITMLKSVTESVGIEANKNITLNLNGFDVTSSALTIDNYGTLEIVGTGTISSNASETPTITNRSTGNITTKQGTVNSQNSAAIYNYGTLQVTESSNITSSATGIGTIYNQATANTVISGGTITSTNCHSVVNSGTLEITEVANINASSSSGNYPAVVNKEGATLTVTGGTINSTGCSGIYNNGGVATISSGQVSALGTQGYAVINVSNTTISGGTLTTAATNLGVILNRAGATLTVNGGTLSSSTSAIINNSGNVEISGTANINGSSADNASINNSTTGSITIAGGTIFAKNCAAVSTSGTIEITGAATITNEATAIGAFYNEATATTTITAGTMESKYSNTLVNLGTVNISGNAYLTGGSTGEPTLANDAGGNIYITGGKVWTDNGNAIINLGNVEISGTANVGSTVTDGPVVANMGGTLKVLGGTVTGAKSNAIYNNNGGTTTISGGTMIGTTSPVVANRESSQMTINGGTINASTTNGIKNYGILTISGSAYIYNSKADTPTVYNMAAGNLTINGGTIANTASGGYAAYNASGTAKYVSGTITGTKNF